MNSLEKTIQLLENRDGKIIPKGVILDQLNSWAWGDPEELFDEAVKAGVFTHDRIDRYKVNIPKSMISN